jgi:hypothetical protein
MFVDVVKRRELVPPAGRPVCFVGVLCSVLRGKSVMEGKGECAHLRWEHVRGIRECGGREGLGVKPFIV